MDKWRVLNFIEAYMKAIPGMSPTYREIQDGVGIASMAKIKQAISELERSGLIKVYGGKRGIVLPSSVLLTKDDAAELGIDWNLLVEIRENNLNTVSLYKSRK